MIDNASKSRTPDEKPLSTIFMTKLDSGETDRKEKTVLLLYDERDCEQCHAWLMKRARIIKFT